MSSILLQGFCVFNYNIGFFTFVTGELANINPSTFPLYFQCLRMWEEYISSVVPYSKHFSSV